MIETTIETPQIVQTGEQHYAFVHVTVPAEQIRQVMGPGLREVYGAVAAQGAGLDGPWFTHHLKNPDAEFDFEICVPVERPIVAEGRVQPGYWPSMRVARTVYHGDYSGLPGAWGEFESWIAAQGLREAKDLWERYMAGPESSQIPSDWRTQLNRPLVD